MIRFTLKKDHPDFNKWFKGTIKSVWESELFFRYSDSDTIALDGTRAMKLLKLATASKWFKFRKEFEGFGGFPFSIEYYYEQKIYDSDRKCKYYWDCICCEKRG